MSVKFEKETIRGTAPLAGQNGLLGRDGSTVHKIGEALTGGESQTGYLAVSRASNMRQREEEAAWLIKITLGIPETTAVEPSSHENAYVWRTLCTARDPRIMASAR